MNEGWKHVDYYTDRHDDRGIGLENFVKDCICRAIHSMRYEDIPFIAIKTDVSEDGAKMGEYIEKRFKCAGHYIFHGEQVEPYEIYEKMKPIFKRVVVTICKLEAKEYPAEYWIYPRGDAFKRDNDEGVMIDSSESAIERTMRISELEKKFRL